MLKFSDLTLAQKRFVVAAIESNEGYKTDPQITLKDCSAIYDSVRNKRTGAKGEKIGYPNWLFANNKIERGVYQLPVPTAKEMSDFAQAMTAKTSGVAKAKAKVAKLATATGVARLEKVIKDSEKVDAEVEEFNAILRENGIAV